VKASRPVHGFRTENVPFAGAECAAVEAEVPTSVRVIFVPSRFELSREFVCPTMIPARLVRTAIPPRLYTTFERHAVETSVLAPFSLIQTIKKRAGLILA
jgi:hypothetical protein